MHRELSNDAILDWTNATPSAGGVRIGVVMATGSSGHEPMLATPSYGLGASPISFERSARMAAVVATLGGAASFALCDVVPASAFAPIDIEITDADHQTQAVDLPETAAETEQARSLAAVIAAIDDEPVEDGVCHRVEPALAAHLEQHGVAGLVEQATRGAVPSRSASLLRLLGRMARIEGNVKRRLVTEGLASAHVEVRDAAIQAVESWEDPELVGLLRQHRDSIAWLDDYAQRVADDLES